MIRFEKIEIEGFASIVKPFVFNLDHIGLNVIRGDNGVGKTTVMNALFWAVSKELLKKKSSIETWEFLRDEDYPGVKVEVFYKDTETGDSYRLVRMKNYKNRVEGSRGGNRVLLYKNDELSNKDGKKDIQEEIIKSLNDITPRVMKNSIFFGQKLNRLTAESPTERKNILDDLFDFKYIDESKKSVDDLIKGIREDLSGIDKDIYKQQSKIESIKENIKITADLINNLEENQKEKINNIKELIETLEMRLSKSKIQLKVKKKDYTEPEKPTLKEIPTVDKTNVIRIIEKLSMLRSRKNILKEELSEIQEVCPTCGKPFDLDGIKKSKDYKLRKMKEIDFEANKLIKERDLELEKNKKTEEKVGKINKSNHKLSIKYKSQLNEYKVNVKDLNEAKISIKILESKISDKKKELTELSNETDKVKELKLKVKGYKIKLKESEIKLNSFKRNEKRLEIKLKRYNWLSKTFSNNGFKAFLYDMKIELINDALEYYAASSGFVVRLEIGDNVKKDINIRVYIRGHEVSINDLSGGQTQLIDLALVFSIHDILNKESMFNFIWLDEAFESLDSKNIPKVNELIESKIKNKTDFSCFITTHLNNYNPVGSNIISMLQVDNSTELV